MLSEIVLLNGLFAFDANEMFGVVFFFEGGQNLHKQQQNCINAVWEFYVCCRDATMVVFLNVG